MTFLQDNFPDFGVHFFPGAANETGGDDCIALYLVAPDHNGTALQHVLFVGGPQMLGSKVTKILGFMGENDREQTVAG